MTGPKDRPSKGGRRIRGARDTVRRPLIARAPSPSATASPPTPASTPGSTSTSASGLRSDAHELAGRLMDAVDAYRTYLRERGWLEDFTRWVASRGDPPDPA